MRKIIYVIGIIGIIGILAGTFAIGTLVNSQTRVVALTVGQAPRSDPPASTSTPFELMVKHGKTLPTEKWDAF
jgi:hypothetical protein